MSEDEQEMSLEEEEEDSDTTGWTETDSEEEEFGWINSPQSPTLDTSNRSWEDSNSNQQSESSNSDGDGEGVWLQFSQEDFEALDQMDILDQMETREDNYSDSNNEAFTESPRSVAESPGSGNESPRSVPESPGSVPESPGSVPESPRSRSPADARGPSESPSRDPAGPSQRQYDLPEVDVGAGVQCGTRRCHSPHCDGPPRKLPRADASTDDEGDACPICLEAWSGCGPHRLVCLKCGHVFGQECVQKWLKSQPVKQRTCPTCKAKANMRDIRPVFARRLVAADTSEAERWRRAAEEARREADRLSLELHEARTQAKQAMRQVQLLRGQMQSKETVGKPATNRYKFSLNKCIEVSAEQSCRVLSYNQKSYQLYASQKSTVPLFPGYGVRKIDCATQKTGQFIPLHPREIRDMDFNHCTDVLLSVSLDRCVKLTCERSNRPVGSARVDRPAWSCRWNTAVSEWLSVGCDGGVCLAFDTRNLSAPYATLACADRSPVIATAFAGNSVAACHLNSCRIYKIGTNGEYTTNDLPLEGPFSSLRYNDEYKTMLISCRPSSAHERARHLISTVDLGSEASVESVHCVRGSRVQRHMSRAGLLRVSGELWTAWYSESDAGVPIYTAGAARLVQTIPMQESVMDLQGFEISGEPFLAALSLNKVRLYKATAS